MKALLVAALCIFASISPAQAGDSDAERISERIQAFHMPHGVVAETRFTTPTSSDMARIFDGDGAIWTGHYLAAEAYHYAVTRSPQALAYLQTALESVRTLCEISGTGMLARTYFPPDSPYIDVSHPNKDWRRVNYNGRDLYYISYVTRDQYVGIFLGLGAVYDLVDDEGMRSVARDLITRLTDYLIDKGWILYNADAVRPLETFVGRWDQMLSVLQLAKHVNPSRFAKVYETTRFWFGWTVGIPIAFTESKAEGHYYGYNLNYGYFFNLIRLEEDPKVREGYLKTYAQLKKKTEGDINAHFNMIDRVLTGPNSTRDQETREALDGLLVRGFRDYPIDLRGKYAECAENVACQTVPVAERVYADFLWQRSPRQLYGGSDGGMESPGVDYILSFWMARYYGVL